MDENRGYQGKRLQPKKRAAKFWSDYGYLLVTVAVVFVLFKVVFQLAYVPTGSMETTVPSKSLMVCWPGARARRGRDLLERRDGQAPRQARHRPAGR